jgi:hypothetical protein
MAYNWYGKPEQLHSALIEHLNSVHKIPEIQKGMCVGLSLELAIAWNNAPVGHTVYNVFDELTLPTQGHIADFDREINRIGMIYQQYSHHFESTHSDTQSIRLITQDVSGDTLNVAKADLPDFLTHNNKSIIVIFRNSKNNIAHAVALLKDHSTGQTFLYDCNLGVLLNVPNLGIDIIRAMTEIYSNNHSDAFTIKYYDIY